MTPPRSSPTTSRPTRRRSLALVLLASAALLLLLLPAATALPQPQDTPGSSVAIHASPADAPDDDGGPPPPITATLFRGAEGPSHCRGGPLTVLALPRPAARHAAERCYDLPAAAACGVFTAARADGCEARLFAEPACLPASFANTHVFGPDARPVGGAWRSMAVRCAVVPPSPEELGAPPLAGLITSQKGG